MAIGLTFHPGLTAPRPSRTALCPGSRFAGRAVKVALAGFDLAALCGVATFVSARVVPADETWIWSFPVVTVAVLAVCGHYELPITLSIARRTKSLLASATGPFLMVFLRVGVSVSSELVILGCTASALIVLLAHGLCHGVVRAARSRGRMSERTLIIGAGKSGVTLSSTLMRHPEYGLTPVGFLDDVDGSDLPLPLFGGVELLRMVVFEERIERVIVAFGVTREEEMLGAIRACETASVAVHVMPRFFELGVAIEGRDVDDVWGIPLVRLRRSRRSRLAETSKRVLDVSVAGVGLAVLAPLYGVLALAVKLSSPGPVHFCQRRVGHNETIVMRKFRTMRVAEGTDTEWAPAGARVTRMGKLLRRTSLDELPQLWNVFVGDMSLVGPRPERPYFVERFKGAVHHYDARHRVPVGLTGLAQVHGLRGDTSIDERARFDNRYVETWSLWRDVVILVQTFSAVLRDALPSRAPRTSVSAPPVPPVPPSPPASMPTLGLQVASDIVCGVLESDTSVV